MSHPVLFVKNDDFIFFQKKNDDFWTPKIVIFSCFFAFFRLFFVAFFHFFQLYIREYLEIGILPFFRGTRKKPLFWRFFHFCQPPVTIYIVDSHKPEKWPFFWPFFGPFFCTFFPLFCSITDKVAYFWCVQFCLFFWN